MDAHRHSLLGWFTPHLQPPSLGVWATWRWPRAPPRAREQALCSWDPQDSKQLVLSVGSQAPQELPGWNLKPASKHQRQGDGERRQTSAEGRWQVEWERDLPYEACPGWLQGGEISTPNCQNLESFYRNLSWVPSQTQSGWSQHHIAISRLCPEAASEAGKASRPHLPRTGGEQEPPMAGLQLMGQPAVPSSWWPPPTV